MIADLLGLVGQVIGVNPDTMAADQSWTKRQEIPFGTGRLQDLKCVDPKSVENKLEFVYQSDIDIPLCVFNDLGCLCHFDGTSLECSGGNNGFIERVDEASCLWS